MRSRFRDRVAQRGINEIGGLRLHTGEKVAVGIQRQRDRGVAQAFRYHFRMDALLEQLRSVRVSQIVKPHMPDTGTADQAPESIPEPVR